MSIVKSLLTTCVAVLLIVFLTVSATLPALASNADSQIERLKLNLGVEEILPTDLVSNDDTTVFEKELRRSINLEKLVCRYIDGQKRCWDE